MASTVDFTLIVFWPSLASVFLFFSLLPAIKFWLQGTCASSWRQVIASVCLCVCLFLCVCVCCLSGFGSWWCLCLWWIGARLCLFVVA